MAVDSWIIRNNLWTLWILWIRPFVTAWDTLSALEVEGGQAQGFKGEMEQETRWDCKRWEVQTGQGKRRCRSILFVCMNTWWEEVKKKEPDYSKWWDNRHKLKYRKFQLNTRKIILINFRSPESDWENVKRLKSNPTVICHLNDCGCFQKLYFRVP